MEIRKNNYAKVNLLVLSGYYCNNVRQTQKDIDPEPISYGDMMILWQVNRIGNPSEHERELALDENSDSNFLVVSYPMYEQETGKLLDITETMGLVVVLRDPDNTFFDNGFGGNEKPLWSGY